MPVIPQRPRLGSIPLTPSHFATAKAFPMAPMPVPVADRVRELQEAKLSAAIAAGSDVLYRFAQAEDSKRAARAFKQCFQYRRQVDHQGDTHIENTRNGNRYLLGTVVPKDRWGVEGEPEPVCMCGDQWFVEMVNTALRGAGFSLRMSCKHHWLERLLAAREAQAARLVSPVAFSWMQAVGLCTAIPCNDQCLWGKAE